MFGYVRICRQELSEKDFNCFNAYYCGLCKAIGKYSNAARMGLSYDMAFLAVLLDSLSEEDSRIGLCRCALHPIHKKSAVKDNIVIDYAASMSILLSYRKLEDDWLDDKDPKALAGGLMSVSYTHLLVLIKYMSRDKKL